MSKELTTIDYGNAEVIATLKSTVASGLSNQEFALFAQYCQSTGLNPFKREVWAIKAGGRLQLMTGINGFFQIANRNSQFDGHESGLVGPQGEYLSLTYPGSDYIGAWCKVYRKDRRVPTEGVAMLSEYDKKQGNWRTMQRVMIVKCAESVALRKAFPQELNGLYTAEEMPLEYQPHPDPTPRQGEILPSKVQSALQVEQLEENEAQLTTLEAMEHDAAYEYDAHGMGNKYKGAKKKALWERLKEQGAVVRGKVLYSYVQIPEIEEFRLMPKEPVIVEVDASDVEDFANGN